LIFNTPNESIEQRFPVFGFRHSHRIDDGENTAYGGTLRQPRSIVWNQSNCYQFPNDWTLPPMPQPYSLRQTRQTKKLTRHVQIARDTSSYELMMGSTTRSVIDGSDCSVVSINARSFSAVVFDWIYKDGL
jgi:hypothetical protein